MPEAKTLAESMVKIFGELENPKFDKVNKHFGNKYPSLPSLLDLVRPVLSKHGVRVSQEVSKLLELQGGYGESQHISEVYQELITEFSNGKESIKYRWPFIPDKGGPQGAGSAGTYARRQGLCAALGIAGEEDDDGEAAEKEDHGKPKTDTASPLVEPGPTLVDTGKNLADDKGTTKDEYIDRISNMLNTMTQGDREQAADMLSTYSAFQGKDGTVKAVRDVRKLSIGWAKSTCHKMEPEYNKWIAEQVDPDAAVKKFIEEGGEIP